MKPVKKLLFGALIVAPLMLVPHQSKAGGLLDWLENLLDHKKPTKDKPAPPTSGNSVPINGGLVVLFAAGLGLGAAGLINQNKKKVIPATI